MTSSHTLVTAFTSCVSAHDAAMDLRKSGFHDIWIGVTIPDTSIKSALVCNGVTWAEAARAERQLAPDDVVLTVNSDDYPGLAAQIIETSGGVVLSGESFFVATITPRKGYEATA